MCIEQRRRMTNRVRNWNVEGQCEGKGEYTQGDLLLKCMPK